MFKNQNGEMAQFNQLGLVRQMQIQGPEPVRTHVKLWAHRCAPVIEAEGKQRQEDPIILVTFMSSEFGVRPRLKTWWRIFE